ncbi:hypothetical protein KR018_011395, partial [Drosophila ironensis]
MRPKEHPDLIFDVIPKLYDSHFKVFVTNLQHVEEQLERMPRKFCRMYTTRPLADQLLLYLRSRNAQVSEQDFHVVSDGQPFELQLSDGRRLEAMLCSASSLGHCLILLIRRPQGGPLLYCYSAARLDNLGRLLGNTVFNSWIAPGTDRLYLNLASVGDQFRHPDYENMAKNIAEIYKKRKEIVVLRVPLFGYEELIWNLGHTPLYGQIKLRGHFADIFACLTKDLKRFEPKNPDDIIKLLVCAKEVRIAETLSPESLNWTSAPTRMHLRQLCSLFRPHHIESVVPFHCRGNVPRVPEFLKCFKATFS